MLTFPRNFVFGLDLGLWYLTPFSTIFQLYHGDPSLKNVTLKSG
jgi:hypothetical protein